MKALILLSALLPAGLIASFLGSVAPQQDETRPDPVVVRDVELAPIEVQAVNINPNQVRGVNLVKALTAVPQDEPAEGRYKVHVLQTNSNSDDGDEHGLTVMDSPLRAQLYTAPATANFAFTYDSDSRKTQQAIDKLRKAKTDEEKADARKQLSAALGEEFDEYLEHQAKELDRLEAKVKKLRGQWDKRREAKDDLVALRMQTLENEANGLGWPAGGGNNFWMGSSPASFGTTSWKGHFPAMAPTVPPVPRVDVNIVGGEPAEVAEEADEPAEVDADMPAEPTQPRQPRTRNRPR